MLSLSAPSPSTRRVISRAGVKMAWVCCCDADLFIEDLNIHYYSTLDGSSTLYQANKSILSYFTCVNSYCLPVMDSAASYAVMVEEL